MPFPLPSPWPTVSYHQGGTVFRADRPDRQGRFTGRLHAACDLKAPPNTPVYAVAAGTVRTVANRSYFREPTYAIEIVHEDSYIVRYGETFGAPGSPLDHQTFPVREGDRVTAGQLVGYVGRLSSGDSMLHFELYTDPSRTGPLSIPNRIRGRGADGQPREYEKGNPVDCTPEDKELILHAGYLWDFQRRSDLTDPTEFIDALRANRPYDLRSGPTGEAADGPWWQDHTGRVQRLPGGPMRVVPSRRFFEEQRREEERRERQRRDRNAPTRVV